MTRAKYLQIILKEGAPGQTKRNELVKAIKKQLNTVNKKHNESILWGYSLIFTLFTNVILCCQQVIQSNDA